MTINFIAEIGSNWEGDSKIAKSHIKEAKKSGANFVKFQMWRAEDLYELNHPEWETIKKSELTKEVAEELKKDLLLASPQRQKIIIRNIIKQYDQELAKTKMFDKIKEGTAGVGILSTPNLLETGIL